MVELGYQLLLAVSLIGGVYALLLGLFKKEPSWFSVGAVSAVELALFVQLIWSIVLVSGGAQAKGDTVEYFGYIITALLVPPASVFWAIIERSRWATVVMGIAGLTVAVMAVRMWQIWSGNVPNF
jgi:uncharacterized membrane protein